MEYSLADLDKFRRRALGTRRFQRAVPQDAPLLLNAPLAETARWKRRVPRLALITVLNAKDFYLHGFK